MGCSTCDHQEEGHSDCIRSVPIFSNLTSEEMLEIALITTAKSFEKGEMVYMAGDKGGTLFVLHTGRVKITRFAANGKEQVIRVIGPGEFMGELSLLSPVAHTDNAEVLEDTMMCVIEGDKLKELMAKYFSIAIKVMEVMSKRLDKAETLIEAINLNTVEQRLAAELLELSEENKVINLKMTKGDLASQLGMSQETLSRRLTTLQDEGIIELKGHRTIIVKDREALEDIQY